MYRLHSLFPFIKNFNFTVFLIFFLSIIAGCNQVSIIPENTSEREVWLIDQAKDFEPAIKEAFKDTLLSDASLQLAEVTANPEKPRATIVYETSEKQIDDIGRKQRVGNIYLLQFVSFQLRKAMCSSFKRTNLHANNVRLSIGIKFNGKINYYISFREDKCLLYK
jgi:hypothetical protein